VASSRTIVIAGAGIGGLVTALALARHDYRVTVVDQAEKLEEIGAGVQLSPNATRVLISLGLGEQLAPHIVAPEALDVMNAPSGRLLARAPLGESAQARYGAPYWVIHRGDLQRVLVETVATTPDIDVKLGITVDDFAVHQNGVTVAAHTRTRSAEERGLALIGADGLWSTVRERLGHKDAPRFARHTAWRATVSAEAVEPELRRPVLQLWLGRHAHVVHYPVKAGRMINVVAIMRDEWHEPGWIAQGERTELLSRFGAGLWPEPVRAMLAGPGRWSKWALFDRPPLSRWGRGPITLLGDAAHPMLPYLAQGAAMAIEDAAVLARALRQTEDVTEALDLYQRNRVDRTARIVEQSTANRRLFHLPSQDAIRAEFSRRNEGESRNRWLYSYNPMTVPLT
jgi:salicylate hydroxylase